MNEPEDVKNILECPNEWNQLTECVIGSAMAVHTALGPGLRECLYQEALEQELSLRGMPFTPQYSVRLSYRGRDLSEQRLDLVVDGLLVVELKSVEDVPNIHLSQLVSYMRAAKLPLGLLINFNTGRLKDGIFRRINPAAIPLHMHRSITVLPLRTSAPL